MCTVKPKQLRQLTYVQVQFTGMTPLGTGLNQKVIQPFLMGGIQNRCMSKPILVIIITDGEPTGEPKATVAQVIKNAKNMSMNSPFGPGAIAFEFAQVGKDQAAQAYLAQLDKDPGERDGSLLPCVPSQPLLGVLCLMQASAFKFLVLAILTLYLISRILQTDHLVSWITLVTTLAESRFIVYMNESPGRYC